MKKIDAKLFASKAFDYMGTPYDNPPAGLKCDSLVEKCLTVSGYKCDWAGTNTMARTKGVFSWLGTPEDCKKIFGRIPVGACPMIWANDGKEPEKYRGDGIGNYSHIGIKTGTGLGAIHASASNGKVCESKFQDKTVSNGGWNRVALLGMVDYGEDIERILNGVEEDDEEVVVSPEVVTIADVPMYKLPSTSSSKLMTVESGSYVIIWEADIGETWNHVSVDEVEGYIQSKYLKRAADLMVKGVIQSTNGKNVNFRKNANKNAGTYKSLPVGTEVVVYECDTPGWTKIEYDGNMGFVMSEFVRVVYAPEDTDQESLSLEDRVAELEKWVDLLKKEWSEKMGWG